jgi:serine protease Do
MRRGDVIVGVGAQAVNSPGQVADAIRKAARQDHAVALRVVRDGQTAFVALSLNGPQNG